MASNKISQNVLTKQLDLLYQQLGASLVGTTAIAAIVVFLLPEFPNRKVLQIWGVLVMVVVLFRAVSAVFHNRAREQNLSKNKRSEILFIIGVMLAGMSWGSLGWWLYPMSIEASSKMVFFIVIIGISGSSMTTLSYRLLPGYLFICLTILPMFIGLYRAPGSQNPALGMALLAYIFFLLKTVRTFQSNSEQMLFLKEKSQIREKTLQDLQKKTKANSLYLDSILQSSSETAIVATDTNFCINYFNTKAEDIFAMDRASVFGKSIAEIHSFKGNHGPDMGHLYKIVDKIRQTGSHHFFMQAGPVAIDARISSINDHTGTFAGFLLMANDITESKRANAQLRKLSRAVEQSHSTIVITDLDANIEFVNPAFTSSTGYTEEEALGQNPRVLKSDLQSASFYQSMWETLTAGKVWQGEMHNKRKDGSLYWEFATISPVKDAAGETTHYVAVKEDITLRKETEEQLIKAQQQADAANQAKSDFLANMSHDIRTPMNGIIGMTRLALDTELSPDQAGYLNNIKLSADSLLGLLNDILDISKIEAGQLVIDKYTFSLTETLNKIVAMLVHTAKEKGLALILEMDTPDLPALVQGDELRLQQILVNLISNGIKFTKNGSVTIKVISEKGKGNLVALHFMVIDTGIGIPADKQEMIFSSFSQAEFSTTRVYGGTGLGLTICRQLTEMLGGKIWLESVVEQGTTFHFTIMMETVNKQKDLQLVDSNNSQIFSLSILLVDDNNLNCEIAHHILEKDGHQVVIAQNGLEALETLTSRNFDLILMDIQMPVMDGLTACTIIRAAENESNLSSFAIPASLEEQLIQQCIGRHRPIVAMTANAMGGDKEKCLAAGMDDYLTKPFEPAQVRGVIADIINSRPL